MRSEGTRRETKSEGEKRGKARTAVAVVLPLDSLVPENWPADFLLLLEARARETTTQMTPAMMATTSKVAPTPVAIPMAREGAWKLKGSATNRVKGKVNTH